MKIKNVNLDDDDYSRHIVGDCDVDCKFCIEEQEEVGHKNKKNKENEGKRT